MDILTRAQARGLKDVRLVGQGMNKILPASDVFRQAEEEGLDVILVSDRGTPPVVKIEDFKKLQYEAKKQKKKKNVSELKEIQLKVNISEHDLATKVNNIEKFLSRGDKVKVVVRLKGRERESPERAGNLLRKVTGMVSCKPNFLPGPIAIAILEGIKEEAK